jgi:hypothetical protein
MCFRKLTAAGKCWLLALRQALAPRTQFSCMDARRFRFDEVLGTQRVHEEEW